MFSLGWVMTQVALQIVQVLVHPLFWLVIVLVALQYYRVASLRRSFLPGRGGVVRDTLVSTLFGLLGGFIGSLLVVGAGLTVSGSGLWYLLPVAIALMLLSPRFLCFAYAGGLVSLANLVFGFPQISIPQVMALVAILHFMEALLILLSGHLGAVPAYVRVSGGRIIGGFTLQKFWPLPVVVLVLVGTLPPGGEGVVMPDWWPLIPHGLPGNGKDLVFAMIPLVAALGYGDFATARTPASKSRVSAVHLAGYSLTLFALAFLAGREPLLSWAAALFSPLGHELVILIGKRLEMDAPPIYTPRRDGLLVLDVAPGSPAWHGGVRSGDLVVEVNGLPVRTRRDLAEALETPGAYELFYLGRDGRYRRETVIRRPGETLGLLPVPDGDEEAFVEMRSGGLLDALRRRRG
ncbi:MAG: PDZ domain-containing protein [Thermoanaerobacterales bacterium]|nr:PDZ domain-containing protein [Thermoanaerobacterales bacterium]